MTEINFQKYTAAAEEIASLFADDALAESLYQGMQEVRSQVEGTGGQNASRELLQELAQDPNALVKYCRGTLSL